METLVNISLANVLRVIGYPQDLYYGDWYFASHDATHPMPFGGIPLKDEYISAPSLTRVAAWLRSEKHIDILPIREKNLSGVYEEKYKLQIIVPPGFIESEPHYTGIGILGRYNTYDEALLKGILAISNILTSKEHE